jgi:hypothetical protein
VGVLPGRVVTDFQPQMQQPPHPRYLGLMRPNCERAANFTIAGEMLVDFVP